MFHVRRVTVSAPVSAPVCVSVSVAPRKDIDTARSRNDIFHRAHPLTSRSPRAQKEQGRSSLRTLHAGSGPCPAGSIVQAQHVAGWTDRPILGQKHLVHVVGLHAHADHGIRALCIQEGLPVVIYSHVTSGPRGSCPPACVKRAQKLPYPDLHFGNPLP